MLSIGHEVLPDILVATLGIGGKSRTWMGDDDVSGFDVCCRQEALRREFEEAKAAERKAVSVSEREAALRLEAAERASAAESAMEQSKEDVRKAMLESESLRKQVKYSTNRMCKRDREARVRIVGKTGTCSSCQLRSDLGRLCLCFFIGAWVFSLRIARVFDFPRKLKV